MYQRSKYVNIVGSFIGVAFGFLLMQQPINASTTSQTDTTTQAVKADSNVLDQGIDGTCKWDVVKDGEDVVLTVHAGQLDYGLSMKLHDSYEITKIVIDPGVIAPKNSMNLFSNFRNVKEFVGLSNLDTSQVINMNQMFWSCGAKELDLSGWDTSNVTDMGAMFAACDRLEKINVKSFDTKNVKNMNVMFFTCKKLRKLDISNFETPNLEDSSMMFGEDSIDYLDMRNFSNLNLKEGNKGFTFDIGFICKLTVGPNLTNESFPQPVPGQIFDDNGIKKIVTEDNWIALNGPDKGTKKNPYEMSNVKRDQPVTYILENKPFINPHLEYKTITRTINLHLPDVYNNEIVSFTQKATIHREVTVNADETKIYGVWSRDYWDEYNAPVTCIGPLRYSPEPSKVDKQIVDGDTTDQAVDIYYK